MHLNPPVMKEATEKIRNGKTEAPKNMMKKNDRFISRFMRKMLPTDPRQWITFRG